MTAPNTKPIPKYTSGSMHQRMSREHGEREGEIANGSHYPCPTVPAALLHEEHAVSHSDRRLPSYRRRSTVEAVSRRFPAPVLLSLLSQAAGRRFHAPNPNLGPSIEVLNLVTLISNINPRR